MNEHFEHTYDGLPISKEPPHGCSIITYRRTEAGIRYLLLHRSHEGPDYEGDWAWGPPAGARLPGEPVDRCAARELEEETGITLTCVPSDLGTREWAVYLCEVPNGTPVQLSAEHDRFDWAPAEEAAKRSLPPFVGEVFRKAEALLAR